VWHHAPPFVSTLQPAINRAACRPVTTPTTVAALLTAAKTCARTLDGLAFAPPVTHVYNPLDYAWDLHAAYLRLAGAGKKQVVFLGMNPGPFGMAQTGVPFGEVPAVRDWMRLSGAVGKPAQEHPKRPVTGLACTRSEVSGRRLWGLFSQRFTTPQAFFADHFVANWCPLAFMEASGKNRTPDQLPGAEATQVAGACDEHLRAVVRALQPDWVIGVGRFAHAAAERAITEKSVRFASIPHPSPANPAANKDWAGAATRALVEQGVWSAR
jgi:single-strand selective monofunctional uracil DNA glycosylase